MIIGGGSLVSYQSARSLGVNPATATGTVAIDSTGGGSEDFDLEVGDYIIYGFGGLSAFFGVVTETGSATNDPTSGTIQNFTVLDNRLRLQWQEVYGVWNMEDEVVAKRLGRPAAPSAPGDESENGDDAVTPGTAIDPVGASSSAGSITAPGNAGLARRRYWSILPEHAESGIRTWHDEPFTARQILNFAFAGAWGDYGFTRTYHSALNSTILYGLDYESGVKLSNLISTINEAAGLEMHIVGARNLVWVRKGEGLLPLPDNTSTNISQGESLNSVATAVRLVGDPIRVQVANVSLEPDWQPAWEAFVDELTWRREVAAVFELPVETKADQAELSAYARQVTVYQYAKQKDDASFLDYRLFGDESRANLPAWIYIQELVFRSYRIPPTSTLYGVPLSSLRMADSLIVGTDLNGTGESAIQDYVANPPEFYPAVQAQVVVKGQPLDLLKARDIRLFYRNREKDLRNEWTVATEFEVDAVNFSIRFSAPVFVDGLASAGESLYLRKNRGEGGGPDLSEIVSDESDYLDVVVPNPNVTLSAAAVKASFCFLIGRYHRVYGKGPRRDTRAANGVGLHLIDVTGTGSFSVDGAVASFEDSLPFPSTSGRTFKEVLYQDGGTAAQKADAVVSSLLDLEPIISTGGFTRQGAALAEVSGVVDRISLNVTVNGVAEQVSYTKAAPTTATFAERTLQRIQRTAELFKGQEENRNEIRQFRLIAAAERGSPSVRQSGSHLTLPDVFTTPAGSNNPETYTVRDKNGVGPVRDGSRKWEAGDIVWLDGDGVPAATGTFGGVVVCEPASIGEGEESEQSRDLTIASAGRVPVGITGTAEPGAILYCSPGQESCSAAGSVAIGRLAHGEAVPVPEEGRVLVMVQLGHGGGEGTQKEVPLHLTKVKPPYVPEPDTPVAEGFTRYYFTWGTLLNRLADNWDSHFDVSDSDPTTWFFAKATLASGSTLRVASWEIVTGPEFDTHETEDWGTNGTRPEIAYTNLAAVVTDPDSYFFNVGGGSLVLSEHVSGIEEGATFGEARVTKNFLWTRVVY
jgi:hypothetical protein